MGILEDGIKAMESHVFVIDQLDTCPDIDGEGTCSNPESTVTYVVSLHSGPKQQSSAIAPCEEIVLICKVRTRI